MLEQDPLSKSLNIRGHHLNRYRQAIHFYHITGSVDRAVDVVLTAWEITLNIECDMSYRHDLLGDNKEKYWSGYRNLLHNFLTLPDSTEVNILNGTKDDICRNCVIGEHCLKPAGEKDTMVTHEYLGRPALISLNSNNKYTLHLGELKQKLLHS